MLYEDCDHRHHLDDEYSIKQMESDLSVLFLALFLFNLSSVLNLMSVHKPNKQALTAQTFTIASALKFWLFLSASASSSSFFFFFSS